MHGVMAALATEGRKARRSQLLWLSALGFALAPLMGGLFMKILQDPDWARRAGLITTKAQLGAGAADWATYVGLLAQAVAVGGLLVFGLVAIWVFGREYSDRTVTDLLALPTARGAIVGAKFVVIVIWAAGLTLLVCALGLGLGAVLGLPGWSPGLAAEAAGRIGTTAGLTIALVAPFAWAASAGRGYLPAIGAMFLALFLSQVLAALGWGAAFPWSVPALASGAAGPDLQRMDAGSYLLVAFTGVAGIAGTLSWWRSADQT